jgi:acetyl esterase
VYGWLRVASRPGPPEWDRGRCIKLLNDALVDLVTGLPQWWNVGAEATREARRQGREPFPPAIKSPRARTIAIQSRDSNEIPLRLIAPAQPRGVYLHIHSGERHLGSPIIA